MIFLVSKNISHLFLIFIYAYFLTNIANADSTIPNNANDFDQAYASRPQAPSSLQCATNNPNYSDCNDRNSKKNRNSLNDLSTSIKLNNISAADLQATFENKIKNFKKLCRFECKKLAEKAISLYKKKNLTKCGHTALEIYSVLIYTGIGYSYINNTLRSQNKTEIDEIRPFINTLNSALDKLNDYQGWVRRGAYGVPHRTSTSLINSSSNTSEFQFTEPAYMSTSINIPFPSHIRYLVKTKHCKYIGPLSLQTHEEEVLCKPNSNFIVKKSFNNELFVIEED